MNWLSRNSIYGSTGLNSAPNPIALTLIALISLVVTSATVSQAQIPTPTILYNFQQLPTDAASPYGTIAQGRDGNLYGTGTFRGANSTGGVFKITPAGTETLLVSFPSTWTNCEGLLLGMDGNFYGACITGGANNLGLIYRMTPAGVLTDLHDFTNTAQDAFPTGSITMGSNGTLYGSTGDPGIGLNGNIFSITTAGVYKSLYSVAGGNSGPSVLSAAPDGAFYGTLADAAGFGNVGGVFKITAAGTFTLLYGFTTATGVYPSSGVIMGSDGRLYGTTFGGAANGNGDIYRLTTAGVITDLFDLNSTLDGAENFNNLLQASTGNFYGASQGGGSGNMGSLYELTSADVYSVFLFTDQNTTGSYPSAPLKQHTNGTVFGTNSTGGSAGSDGTFFKLNIGASPFIALVTPVYSGKEGSRVGILGQGFTSGSVVKFGGTAATTIQRSGGAFIEATVPSGALTGKVTVTTGSTTLSTNSNYKITPTPPTFTPTSGPVGTLVTSQAPL